MNNRVFKLMISVAVLLAVIVLFSYQAEAKRIKQINPVKPADKTIYVEPNAAATPPSIKFDTLVHDFCEVSPDSTNSCSFKFTNTGPGKLIITQTSGTCKCTVPELAKKEYNPGESGEITVSFHAPMYAGPTSQNVHVSSNDPENPKIELTIRASVVSKVRTTPEIMNLSLVDANNAGAVPVTIKSIDNEKFAILSINSEGNVFSVPFDPNNKSDTHILYPKVNIENLRRYLGGQLVFNIDHPACKFVRIQYNCLKEFEASPSVIIIRDANVGQPQDRSIYLVSNYNEPIEIESVTSEKGIIKVTRQEQTENRYKIDVQIMPPSRQGQTRVFSDNLQIKIKNKQEITIACRGFYRAG
ncbi:MAG: DUF1573 domain-containing protein [Sedimentisphaerales bacterium]